MAAEEVVAGAAAEEVAEEVVAEEVAEEVAAEEVAAEEVAEEVVFPCERITYGQLSQLRSQLWMFQPRAPLHQRLIGPQALRGGCGPWTRRG
jgi:hypothetical protein